MATQIFQDDVTRAILDAQAAALKPVTRPASVGGQTRQVLYPFPSPADWRDTWIYFLMIDRFNNPAAPPRSTPAIAWDGIYGQRQGGTFKGVQDQLGYLEDLGVRALWLSPVLKNPRPDWDYNYHGYQAQDFLSLDARFATDGTLATAEKEYAALLSEAHARGMHVVQDIVINHAARVFDYAFGSATVDDLQGGAYLNVPPGQEPDIEWINGLGFPRADWRNTLPSPPTALSPDDAVWPEDLQRLNFFRRRGDKVTDMPPKDGFVPGDFGDLRQFTAEYNALAEGQSPLRETYGATPVLAILIRAYQYLIARYDLDGFRIDTVKYVDPGIVETFGNAMREFGLSVGKANFFTFGEIADQEDVIEGFVGRHTPGSDGFGIDAALDFPLCGQLPGVAKSQNEVQTVQRIFEARKQSERGLISSHGEAGRYFVSFLDNHDRHRRFKDPGTPQEQVTLGLAALFCLQGIPCVYYGTEQGLQGAKDGNGVPKLDSFESVREALWGKGSPAFDPSHALYRHLRQLADLRASQPPLRYGRLYFREVSGNGQDFGFSQGRGGVLAFSRILTDREVIFVANTSFDTEFSGSVLADVDLSRRQRLLRVGYSNLGRTGTVAAATQTANVHHPDGTVDTDLIASLSIVLQPMEVQVFVP